MSVETVKYTEEFEKMLPLETERKLLPVFPEQLAELREQSFPIEQFYLSHIDEPFSLRMRETYRDGELYYEATLKDTGTIVSDGLQRLEIQVPIPAELYGYYFDEHTTPVLRKLRSEPLPGIAVDFYEDGSIQVESESPRHWPDFVSYYGNAFVDITGDHLGSNEWRAHLSFRRLHDGHEAFAPEHELRSDDIVHDVLARGASAPVIVHVGGRSGSGKSTIVREVRAQLEALGMTSDVMSTDDYHRGTSWLRNYNGGQEWTHWDEPIVYDTVTMAADIATLKNGGTIRRREIDWSVAEPCSAGTMTMPDVLLVEGIYANSPDITCADDLTYEMTTPLATCIGRRLLRDLRERPQFADPAESLYYMLTEAEPAYRTQLATS